MKINKALIAVAGPEHRELPMQTIINQNREKKTVLEILVDEITEAGIDQIGVVVRPDDKDYFEQTFGRNAQHIEFIPQTNPNGYGYAILAAKSFLQNESFLHLVGDHLYISKPNNNMAQQVMHVAMNNKCSVSAVQPIRENEIVHFGTIGATRLPGKNNLYQIKQVKEKPTPAYAEQFLMIPGLRTAYYLCFYGMHVFTPDIPELLEDFAKENKGKNLGLSESLNEFSKYSKYLALEMDNLSYDIGNDYGLLKAQLALSLSGKDRDYVLNELMKLFIEREKMMKGGY